MELFTVNRYTEEQPDKAKKNEDEILQRILQKVERRKRKRSTSTLDESVAQEQHDEKNNKREVGNDVALECPSSNAEATEDVDPLQVTTDTPAESGDASHFEILGEDIDVKKRQKVDVVLPPWLAHPTIISTSIAVACSTDETPTVEANITKLPFLAPHIRHALKELNITRLFPVQSAVIPWILEAHAKPPPFRVRDICVSAPTGSGKTLAFAVPVVQLLADRVVRKIRALVVLPVAELALQVFKVFKKLCDKTDLSVCLLSKQYPFSLEQEKLVECYKGQYYSKVDIVVTTPGRLVDHLHATKGFCLKALRFLVIDEADRIMDAVFQNWLYHLDEHVRSTSDQLLSGRAAPLCYAELEHSASVQPHKLLFSATLSQDPEKLQNLRLFQPKLFTSVLANLEELREKFATAAANRAEDEQAAARGGFIGKYTTPAELTEKYCITENRIKPLTLYALVEENGWTKFLCFTNSAEASGRLAYVLTQLFNDNLKIKDLSASISAKERANVLSQFSRGLVNGLVCSDALARGIDIPDVDVVISYDPPRHIKTYIHRIGRTARAGNPGTAITLLTQKELNIFNQTLAEVGKMITNEITVSPTTEEKYAKSYTVALQMLREKLEQDKRTKLLRRERAKNHALVTKKDPASMTVMEKLQVQAHQQIHITAEPDKGKLLGSKRNPNKRKKFNASAGKSKAILK